MVTCQSHKRFSGMERQRLCKGGTQFAGKTPEHGSPHGKLLPGLCPCSSAPFTAVIWVLQTSPWAACTEPMCHGEEARAFHCSLRSPDCNLGPLCLIQLYLSYLIIWFLIFFPGFLVVAAIFLFLEVFT